MGEKATLLPTAPADDRFVQAGPSAQPTDHQHSSIPMPRLVIAPGLEFDPSRRSKYGNHALFAAIFIFAAFILVELRDCNFGIGTDLDKLQALHISMMVFAFVLYLLSLFGIADFVFQFKIFFFVGILVVYAFVGIMIWMTYEAAVNPCVKTFNFPVDFSYSPNKNVFSRGDAIGIIVLLLDIVGTVLMFSAALNFYRRY